MFLLLNTLKTTPEMLLFSADKPRTLQTPAEQQYYFATGVVGEGGWRLCQDVNHVTKLIGLVKWYKVW